MKYFLAGFSFCFILLLNSNCYAQSVELYELNSINIEGNNEFSDSELKGVIQSKESPFWLWKFFDSFTPFGSPPIYFDSTAITIDIVSLKSFYVVNGFFEPKFSYSYYLDTTSKTVELTYFVSEGSGFNYGSVNVYGFEGKEYLNPLISPHIIFSGRYAQSNLTSNVDEVLSVLKNNGYMLASFDSTLIIMDTLKNKTNLEIYFTPGDKYSYDEIRIVKNGEGSELVSDDLIKYVTNIHEGQVYNEHEIAKSRLRLARTGLFNTINLKGVANDTNSNKVRLDIIGNIGTLNDLSPEVFIDNEFNTSNIGVGLSYIRKNFLGEARKLTLSTKFKVNDIQNLKLFSSSAKDSTLQTQVDVSLLMEQPFFFSRRISASLEAYYKTYNIFFTPFENAGGKLRLAFDMPTYTFVNVLNPYLTLDILGYDIITSNGSFNYTPRSTTAILGGTIGSTTANDFFFPSKGYNLNQVLEVALTQTKISTNNQLVLDSLKSLGLHEDDVGLYYRFQTNLAYYFNVSRDDNTVTAIKFNIGFIQTFVGGDELIPPNQTFFAGGANSVRGWKARELVPANQIEFVGVSNPVEANIRGGTFILEGSIEYRRKFHPDFGFTLFVDYGNTWNGYKNFQFKQVAVATGFGLRYYSPFAPFRIDFGWKLWDPKNQITLFQRKFWDSIEFHFGIGEAF
jgi:outer membrane protein insertion porin family